MKARGGGGGRWRRAHPILLLFYFLLEYPTGASAEDKEPVRFQLLNSHSH